VIIELAKVEPPITFAVVDDTPIADEGGVVVVGVVVVPLPPL